MKKQILLLVGALICGINSTFGYDFSAECSTGQTLYYNITNADSHEVELTYPGDDPSLPWYGYGLIYGDIIFPENVEYDNITYTVTSIGESAFYGCESIATIVIPNTVTTIGNSAFSTCTGMVRGLVIPDSVTTIGSGAFSYCIGLTDDLILGNSITTIGDWAFAGCYFADDITIPETVISIGPHAFRDCKFRSVVFNASNCNTIGTFEEKVFADCLYLSSLTIGENVKTIPDYAFCDCDGLSGNLVIPNSVTSIGDYAFSNCRGFTGNLTIPENVVSIGKNAFSGCSRFTGDLVIPNNVNEIGEYAFENCNGIGDNLIIGESVATIGSNAFSNCNSISSITLHCGEAPTLYPDAFLGIDTSTPIYIPCGTKQSYQEADNWEQFTNFRQMPYFEFTVKSENDNWGIVNILQEPDCETDGMVEAIADEGCSFVGWKENGEIVSTDNPYTFTQTDDLELVAVFSGMGVDNHAMIHIAAYPNPTAGQITIEGQDIQKIEVYNSMGQLIITKVVYDGKTEIDLDDAPCGIYLLRATSKECTIEQDIVKQ